MSNNSSVHFQLYDLNLIINILPTDLGLARENGKWSWFTSHRQLKINSLAYVKGFF